MLPPGDFRFNPVLSRWDVWIRVVMLEHDGVQLINSFCIADAICAIQTGAIPIGWCSSSSIYHYFMPILISVDLISLDINFICSFLY